MAWVSVGGQGLALLLFKIEKELPKKTLNIRARINKFFAK
jgi:hypothetical protein